MAQQVVSGGGARPGRLRRRHRSARRTGGGPRRSRAVGRWPRRGRGARRRGQGAGSPHHRRGPATARAAPRVDWAAALRTSWVEPGYLEPDASWCGPAASRPPRSPTAAPSAARRAPRRQPWPGAWPTSTGGRCGSLLAREDVVRPARSVRLLPAAWTLTDAACCGWCAPLASPRPCASWRPLLQVEEVDVAGPPTSVALRAAGWAEATVLLAGARGAARPGHRPPHGRPGRRRPSPTASSGCGWRPATRSTRWCCGPTPPVPPTWRCRGSAPRGSRSTAPAWCTTSPSAPSASCGRSTPRRSRWRCVSGAGPSVRGSDAVFAAVAAAAWLHLGCPVDWPTGARWR